MKYSKLLTSEANKKIFANQINKDVKNLVKMIKALRKANPNAYFTPEIEKEFKRIYNLDRTFEYMNKTSVLIMFRLNQRYRFEALHTFGIFYNIPGLDS